MTDTATEPVAATADDILATLKAAREALEAVAYAYHSSSQRINAAIYRRVRDAHRRCGESQTALQLGIQAIRDDHHEKAVDEWRVFYGGPDPDSCAGWFDSADRAGAEQCLQWVRQSGVARRSVFYGPWVVTQAPGGSDD